MTTIHHTGFGFDPRNYGKRVLDLTRFVDQSKEGDLTIEEIGEAAFRITNDPAVTDEVLASVIKSSEGRCYSLSVGDVVEANGEFAIVVGVGFTPITKDEFERLLNRWECWNEEPPASGERWEMGFHGVRYITLRRKSQIATFKPAPSSVIFQHNRTTYPVTLSAGE